MSFIRGAVITLFGLVLTISLVLMNVSITFASSLEYDEIKPALETSATGIIGSFLDFESVFGEQGIYSYCDVESSYTFTYGSENFVIPCEVIEQGEDSITQYIGDNFIEQIYYAEYDCDFWSCVENSEIPFVLISDKARVYWSGRAFLLALMSVVLFGLIFLVSDKRSSKFISVGVLIALCSLPFKNMDWVLKLVPAQVAPLFSLFSQKAHSVFVIMLIVSIVLILIGIVAIIFGWKMKFKEDSPETKKVVEKPTSNEDPVSKEEVIKIVKQELSKKNPTNKINKKIQKSKQKKKN